MSLKDLSKIVLPKTGKEAFLHSQQDRACISKGSCRPADTNVKPDWKISYCQGCEQQTRYLYQNFELNGKHYENYICENCGMVGK